MPQAAADISVWIQRLERAPLPARRASPDLLRQLQQCIRRPVDRVLCIAADVDPAVDLLRETFKSQRANVAAGLGLIEEMLPVRQIVVDERYARRFDARYPNLDPVLLVHRLFGRRLRPGALPTDAGVLVLDAIAAAQLGRLSRGEPAGALPVIIDDLSAHRRLRLNTEADRTVRSIFAEAGLSQTDKLVRHGPLMREQTLSLDTPIGQTELWLHMIDPPACIVPESCIRCGDCVVACPARIHPAALLEAAQRRDRAMGDRFGRHACMECGICTHVCPSRLPVLASIRQLKRLSE